MIEARTMTPEQQKFHADLVVKYGAAIVAQARHLSGIKLNIQALAVDELSAEERAKAYIRAGSHLAELLELLMTYLPKKAYEQRHKLTECSQVLDTAIDLWMADEIEQRDGLPPA